VSSARYLRLAVALLGTLVGAGTIGAGSAAAAPAFSWSVPSPFDVGHLPSGVSCASE
jgi:hypothetical protein